MLGKPNESRKLFAKAITTATRNGFQNDKALANERCSDMCATVLKDGDWAGQYFENAILAYKAMEASGKVDAMRQHLSSTRHDIQPRENFGT
jgi:hypothetical protein